MNHCKNSKDHFWRSMWAVALASALILSTGVVLAQDSIEIENEYQSVLDYWTPERMREAVPLDMAREAEPGAADTPAVMVLPDDAKPRFSEGWLPGSGPQPDPTKLYEITQDSPLYRLSGDGDEPLTQGPFSPPAFASDWLNYGKFDRYTHFGAYLNRRMAVIGKLFFTVRGSASSCTASVIGRRTIATAAHCLRDSIGWFDNWVFCPSYNNVHGINPQRGCWPWGGFAKVSIAWANSRATDRDYGCLITAPTGTVWGRRVGDVTGWTGRAANWRTTQHVFAFGYPADPPFRGNVIVNCAAVEWYQLNRSFNDGTVDQISKYIGCDQTGGSSGGPWWVGISHPNSFVEPPAVDPSIYTDIGQGLAGGPWINGVNSSRRRDGTGTYISEMSAPQFRDTGADADESEDVFQWCLTRE